MLKGKTALITGANGGIGKSILDLLLKNKANIICLIRKSDKKFINNIKKLNKNIKIIISDITNEEELKTQINNTFLKKKN